ncbi:MAG: MATE family efflux transporter [Oscillospiraceae bacterium]|nr:MATE family efflux transporter [Oscillospiraceae bacterium]
MPCKRRDVDMTEDNITRHIISFAIPLLIGNIFQQLYNTVDTWVVGNYVNNQAYSAVGTVGPIVNMLIGFFMGLSSGAGVVISQYYGAHQPDKVKQTVHTALLMTLILGAIFTVLGIAMIPVMLNLINMPENVQGEATTYLTIYFAGILGLMFYNIGAGILRAVGDSQRPFYFLVVSAVINIVLDLVFVLVINMGVAGVALATIIAQGTSAVLIIITLLRTSACIKLIPKELKIHWDMLKKIFTVGIPAAVQMAITAFSNIFVQSYINHFGEFCMSGWTTYAKVDQLLFLPMQSISLASTTFVGQNLGRNQPERARQGVRTSLLLALAATAILTVPVMIFAKPIVTFFNADPQVVEYGTLLLQWLSPFYLLCCFNQIYSGALRGAGNSRAPMIIMLSSFVLFRQVYLFIMAQVCNEILPIAMSYPAGWLVCTIATTVYYHKVQLSKTRLVEDHPQAD